MVLLCIVVLHLEVLLIATNRLRLQHGDSLKLSNLYSCKHPTLLDIVELQTDQDDIYLQYVNTLTSTSLDIADVLYKECNIWYEDIKNEWTFFIEKGLSSQRIVNMYKISDNGEKSFPETTYLIDKEIGNALAFFFNTTNEYAVLLKDEQMSLVNVNKESEQLYNYTGKSFIFTEIFYKMTQQFLSEINWTSTKDHQVVHGGTRRAKKYILEMEYKARIDDARKQRKPSVTLDSIVSALVAKGMSYDTIWHLPIYMVYDQYQRQVQLNQWDNTMRALSSGNLNTKKNPINWDKINWSRVLN